MPLTGTVNETNPALDSQPELVNSDPYGEGWMVKISIKNASEVEDLLSAEAYKVAYGRLSLIEDVIKISQAHYFVGLIYFCHVLHQIWGRHYQSAHILFRL